MISFSPLTGINYVETSQTPLINGEPAKLGFSPLTGINYVETLIPDFSFEDSLELFQSPYGD